MRITGTRLRRIIKEELSRSLLKEEKVAELLTGDLEPIMNQIVEPARKWINGEPIKGWSGKPGTTGKGRQGWNILMTIHQEDDELHGVYTSLEHQGKDLSTSSEMELERLDNNIYDLVTKKDIPDELSSALKAMSATMKKENTSATTFPLQVTYVEPEGGKTEYGEEDFGEGFRMGSSLTRSDIRQLILREMTQTPIVSGQ